MKRTLVLRRRQLAELTTEDLLDVVAAAAPTKDCPDHTYYCVTGTAICQSRVVCA